MSGLNAIVGDDDDRAGSIIRPARDGDRAEMLAIINDAAEAYRGVIPADRWHDPYMSAGALAAEIADGVMFSCCLAGSRMTGVMGVQRRHNVDLIRHAYVRSAAQGSGVGSALIADLRARTDRTVLVGTWRAAEWAIRFYERHGFTRVAEQDVAQLLRTYWTIPDRQIATSIVLSAPALGNGDAAALIAGRQASITAAGT